MPQCPWGMDEGATLPRQRRRRRSGRYRRVGAVLVITLPLIGWGALALTSDDPPGQEPGADHGARPAADQSATTDPGSAEATSANSYELAHAARTAIEHCAARLQAGQDVVDEAEVGIGHWSEHVNARTDLLAGRNTSDETRAIWKRTKLAGPADLGRVDAAMSAYQALPGCADFDVRQAPQEWRSEMRACSSRATSIAATVASAMAAMADWEHHLNAMAAHADGLMDAGEAQEMWVEAWANAPTNIDGFHDALDELKRAPDCRGSAR